MVVTDVWKALLYRLGNRNKKKILGFGMFGDLLAEDLLKTLESNLSHDDVSKNLPFWVRFQEGIEILVCCRRTCCNSMTGLVISTALGCILGEVY